MSSSLQGLDVLYLEPSATPNWPSLDFFFLLSGQDFDETIITTLTFDCSFSLCAANVSYPTQCSVTQCVTVQRSTRLQDRWQLSIMHMVHCHDRLVYCFAQCCSNPSNGLLLNRLELSKLLICHCLDTHTHCETDTLQTRTILCVCASLGVCVCVFIHFKHVF